ncbi:hypothetical protein PPYR_02555 [Photinus pyralis]|uniref:Elongation of very long chain fatty acids protein n=1 Tax=Photinus pyralis TaxID=7054 RepID=A0A5N4B7K7_PHOPY|nr:hypothetical protein PPYR_02555 [Photinus pyralis]
MNCSVGSTHLEGMDYINEYYELIFIKWADERTATLPLMSSPFPIFGLLITYLYVVFIYLPNYMTHKKPYSLKGYLTVYNLFQVIACCVLIYGVATSGWTSTYTLGCQEVDYSEDSSVSIRMAKFMWWHMIVKMSELLETIIFLLRQKSSQVTVLHVYHHVSTLIIAWIACKYFPGGMISFTVLINSFVHIIMYTYYLLSSFGPHMQNRLKWIKRKITIIQMVQLAIILAHTGQVLLPSCRVPNIVAYIYLPNVSINIFLFARMYFETYFKKSKTILLVSIDVYLHHSFITFCTDPRVHDWPFMSNPWKIIAIIGIYLYMIYVYLPSFMSDKKPYSLKGIIVVYNIFQLFACITIIYGVITKLNASDCILDKNTERRTSYLKSHTKERNSTDVQLPPCESNDFFCKMCNAFVLQLATSGWTTRYRLICEPVDYSENAMAVRMASYMWWTLLLKMTELLETIIFVLRKKYNQVSSLHVYHHISTLSAAWIVCKYVPGGLLTFTPMINSLVHIFMYTYYFLAAMSPGPQLQKTLTWIKPKLTMVQLVQLVIIIVQNMQLFLPGCGIHNVVGFIFLPNVCVNVIFFLNFYTKSYRNKNVSKTN